MTSEKMPNHESIRQRALSASRVARVLAVAQRCIDLARSPVFVLTWLAMLVPAYCIVTQVLHVTSPALALAFTVTAGTAMSLPIVTSVTVESPAEP